MKDHTPEQVFLSVDGTIPSRSNQFTREEGIHEFAHVFLQKRSIPLYVTCNKKFKEYLHPGFL